jgi:hypothetical protein
VNAVRRLWRGDVPLADAIWNWAIFGALAVNLSTTGLFLWLIAAERPVAAFIAGYAVSVPYNIFVTVGVWRSAGRYSGPRQRAEMARIGTVIWMLILSLL